MPSVKTKFSINDTDIERIRESILRCGYTSEEVINDYLHTVAGVDIVKGITKFIPRSEKGKYHAKDHNWSEQTDYNLAVNIANSLKGKRGTSFYYLYYVITGTGTSKKKGPNDFMKKGLDNKYDSVVNGIIEALDKNIEREMK